MRVLAIDPGTKESAYLVLRRVRGKWNPWAFEKCANQQLVTALSSREFEPRSICIERLQTFGMPVGEATFRTAYWIGRFIQAAMPIRVYLMYRSTVRGHICHSSKATDSNIRQALIDKYGAPGTKKNPGPTYGIKADIWSALAIATTFVETDEAEEVDW